MNAAALLNDMIHCVPGLSLATATLVAAGIVGLAVALAVVDHYLL